MHKYVSRLHIPHGTLVAVCWISSNQIKQFTYYITENTENASSVLMYKVATFAMGDRAALSSDLEVVW